jgi:hypothetical protein
VCASSFSGTFVAGSECFIVVGTVVIGVIVHVLPMTIAAEDIAALALSQLSYISVSVTIHPSHSSKVIPPVQAAIGRQLNAELTCRAVCRRNCMRSSGGCGLPSRVIATDAGDVTAWGTPESASVS